MNINLYPVASDVTGMTVGIVGAGALGSAYGGLLVNAGYDVRYLEIDDDIVDAIRSNGLRIEMPTDEDLLQVDVPITSDPTEIGVVDILFIFTKSFDTEQAIQDAKPMVGSETIVVTVQNGVTNMDDLAKHVGSDRVVGGYTHVGSNKIGPGHVKLLGANQTIIGGPDLDGAKRVASMMRDAGIPTEAVADPLPHIWKKQLRTNVARKPIAALTELRNGPQVEFEETKEIAKLLIEEAVAVAEAKGIEILVDDPVNGFLETVPPEKYDKKSSILEDIENKRRTEIESINGAVVRYGEEEGIDVPYNRLVTALVRAKERGYLENPNNL